VELRPGETPWFSATLAPPAVRVKFLDILAIRINLVDAAGQDCVPSSAVSIDLGVFGKVVAQTALLESGPVGDRRWSASCKAGGKLYLKVTRLGDAFAAQALPLELAFRLEPAVTDPGPPAIDELASQLPPPAAGKPAEIDGGTSFNDAPGSSRAPTPRRSAWGRPASTGSGSAGASAWPTASASPASRASASKRGP
jgi:hypothetical protein